ncbi:hypothetical protein ABZR71_20015 [Pseudomonas paraeruginosa]|uniref:Uncharacterized protein n=1 Tax=Pseudomonas paraeruginosa TaxID=2994495 RepID=A0A2R3IWY1_9PSED|nr:MULTISPECIES: hypothetical protein [Pseudomonas aeruginosa group]AVK06431.1 hypothetical protein CSB93_2882 [Pseudomonas paraeruginosa]AWE90405.1 hypothetical protein CSC28_1654 [Pseudomonas paraeruginosa]MBG4070710.1 hypothetical protein [Pseudomonas aeruginosa]MBG4201059.1 hypothetical protein [Pseudomonas aeruginosa]MBG5751424.1 hypothetical protein [Pseudomonas aeruginosa]
MSGAIASESVDHGPGIRPLRWFLQVLESAILEPPIPRPKNFLDFRY